jgi:hypothetical protein
MVDDLFNSLQTPIHITSTNLPRPEWFFLITHPFGDEIQYSYST